MSQQIVSELVRYVTECLEIKLRQNIRITEISPVGGGCIHHASCLMTNAGMFFLKWNNHGAKDLFVREAECLRILKNAAGDSLVIPEVLFAEMTTERPGFILMEYLEPGSSSGSIESLGRGLATIHRFTSNRFGFYHDNYCGSTLQENKWSGQWADFYVVRRIEPLLRRLYSIGAYSPEQVREFDRLINRIPDLLPENSVPSLIHGDLWSGNYLYTVKGPALIDPACYFADREMEMGIMTLFGGFPDRFWSAYNEIYPLDHEWRSRNQLYQLYHLLNHFLIFGGGYGSPALEIARRFGG
jgi:fructosamine-3-kinase